MEFQPLEDKVLIREIKSKDLATTEGGILLAPTVKSETFKAEVMAIGAGFWARDTGVFIPTTLGKGDLVLIPTGQGMPISVNGEDFKVIREGDVLGKVGRVEEKEN